MANVWDQLAAEGYGTGNFSSFVSQPQQTQPSSGSTGSKPDISWAHTERDVDGDGVGGTASDQLANFQHLYDSNTTLYNADTGTIDDASFANDSAVVDYFEAGSGNKVVDKLPDGVTAAQASDAGVAHNRGPIVRGVTGSDPEQVQELLTNPLSPFHKDKLGQPAGTYNGGAAAAPAGSQAVPAPAPAANSELQTRAAPASYPGTATTFKPTETAESIGTYHTLEGTTSPGDTRFDSLLDKAKAARAEKEANEAITLEGRIAPGDTRFDPINNAVQEAVKETAAKEEASKVTSDAVSANQAQAKKAADARKAAAAAQAKKAADAKKAVARAAAANEQAEKDAAAATAAKYAEAEKAAEAIETAALSQPVEKVKPIATSDGPAVEREQETSSTSANDESTASGTGVAVTLDSLTTPNGGSAPAADRDSDSESQSSASSDTASTAATGTSDQATPMEVVRGPVAIDGSSYVNDEKVDQVAAETPASPVSRPSLDRHHASAAGGQQSNVGSMNGNDHASQVLGAQAPHVGANPHYTNRTRVASTHGIGMDISGLQN